jgi:hypothetical protein
MARLLKLAEKRGLKLAMAMVIGLVGFEYLVEPLE